MHKGEVQVWDTGSERRTPPFDLATATRNHRSKAQVAQGERRGCRLNPVISRQGFHRKLRKQKKPKYRKTLAPALLRPR